MASQGEQAQAQAQSLAPATANTSAEPMQTTTIPTTTTQQVITLADGPGTSSLANGHDERPVVEIYTGLITLSEENASKLRTQIEFYFSESNVPRDRYFRERIEEGSGMVEVAIISSFRNIRKIFE